jgi:hypothetical protein
MGDAECKEFSPAESVSMLDSSDLSKRLMGLGLSVDGGIGPQKRDSLKANRSVRSNNFRP